MARNKSSINLNKLGKDRSIGMPNYVVHKPKFSCPISVGIAWHWGLQYCECPVGDGERDMSACYSCPLKGDGVASEKNDRKKKNFSKVERRVKTGEVVPKIGKTYHSK